MDDYRTARRAPTRCSDGHIDPRSALRQQVPQDGRAHVTEHGAFSPGKDSSEEAAIRTQAWPSYRVHAPVQAMEMPSSEASTDGGVVEAEREELGPSDHPVLPVAEGHDPVIS